MSLAGAARGDVDHRRPLAGPFRLGSAAESPHLHAAGAITALLASAASQTDNLWLGGKPIATKISTAAGFRARVSISSQGNNNRTGD